MHKLLCVAGIVAFGLLGIGAHGATVVKKKSTAKKGSPAAVASATRKKAAITKASTPKTASSKTSAARRGKKAPVRRTTWRNRQLAPTPERYKEIQEALSAKGYLPAGQATGKWDDASAAALQKFQADQNLGGSGKINSLSLIALGLGPKHETTASAKPTAPTTVTP